MLMKNEYLEIIQQRISEFNFLSNRQAIKNRKKLKAILENLLEQEQFEILMFLLKDLREKQEERKRIVRELFEKVAGGLYAALAMIIIVGYLGLTLFAFETLGIAVGLGILFGAIIALPILLLTIAIPVLMIAGLVTLPTLIKQQAKKTQILEEGLQWVEDKVNWMEYGKQFVPKKEKLTPETIIKNGTPHYPKPIQDKIVYQLMLFKRVSNKNFTIPKPIQLDIISQTLVF